MCSVKSTEYLLYLRNISLTLLDEKLLGLTKIFVENKNKNVFVFELKCYVTLTFDIEIFELE